MISRITSLLEIYEVVLIGTYYRCTHHVGPLFTGSMILTKDWMKDDIKMRKEYLAKNKIDKCMLFPVNNYITSRGIEAEINDFIYEYREQASDIVYGICCTVSPREGEAALKEVYRCLGNFDFDGVVFLIDF
jgi:predicted TIM-barrel fold metal-dependent hydrolase